MTFKVDHEFHPWFRMNASYLHYKSREPGAAHQGYPVSPTGTWLDRKVDTTQVNAIITPDATTVVSVRWGFNRFPNVFTNIALDGGFSAAQLGFGSDFVQGRQIDGFPEFQMEQFADAGRGGLSDTKVLLAEFSNECFEVPGYP